MVRSSVKTIKYRVGKNKYLIINIYQSSEASAQQGNVLASNAATVQIFKNQSAASSLSSLIPHPSTKQQYFTHASKEVITCPLNILSRATQ